VHMIAIKHGGRERDCVFVCVCVCTEDKVRKNMGEKDIQKERFRNEERRREIEDKNEGNREIEEYRNRKERVNEREIKCI
jgi:hypothetical protein